MAATSPAMTNLLTDFRAAVADCDNVALDDTRAETYHVPITPYLGADHLTRKNRRGKSPGHRRQSCRVIVANRLKERGAGDPERGETMQDRARKAGGPGEFR